MSNRSHDLHRVLEVVGPGLHRLFYRITLREDGAEDLLHDLFIRLSTSEAFQACKDPDRYATRAAVHLAIDWRRANRRTSILAEAESPAPPDHPEQREDLQRVLDGIISLRGLMRDAVILRYLYGADYRGIAAALDRSPHQARALCRKGIARLTASLQTKGVVPCDR